MKQFVVCLSFLSFAVSCSLTDNFNEEPMYLQISEAQFEPPNGIDPSSQIKDVWVFADGFNIGIFELPARVPVLGTNEVELNLLPGIRNSGQANFAKDYPFYTPTNLTLAFEPNAIKELELNTRYIDDIKFGVNEDFEGTNVFSEDLDGDTLSTLKVVEETIFGNYCGRIDVSETSIRFEQATRIKYPTDVFSSSQVYLEFDYRSDVNFVVGYIGFDGVIRQTVGVITLFPSEDWNKLYLDLSADLNGGTWDSYQILIAGSGLAESGSIWLDNIRLVHL